MWCYDNIDACVEHCSGAADWNGVESERTLGKDANMIQVWNINLCFIHGTNLCKQRKFLCLVS